jgi:nuclear pore complex protein Nup98-Nup96
VLEWVSVGAWTVLLMGSGQAVETAALLRLPLTEDVYLKHTRELSVNYYRAVLAAGR